MLVGSLRWPRVCASGHKEKSLVDVRFRGHMICSRLVVYTSNYALRGARQTKYCKFTVA